METNLTFKQLREGEGFGKDRPSRNYTWTYVYRMNAIRAVFVPPSLRRGPTASSA